MCAGSVENHSGHLFTPASRMGFWCDILGDVQTRLQRLKYDDVRCFEVPNPNATGAYRVTKWIERSAYRAVARNCEDDVYDVLRMYGVQHLEAPFFNWFPRWWFSRLKGPKMPLSAWRDAGALRAAQGDTIFETLPALKPAWRKPLHGEFRRLQLRKLLHFH
ncbi:MAG: hypothetical protein ABR508_10065 [Candidatus Baltobacteraceae bacterium]